jgi:hypothetical protein
MHQLVVDHLGVDDNLPCADYGLLTPLKRSRDYRVIRERVADLHPADAWQQEGFHFFVFVLRAADDTDQVLPEPPIAVFAMHPEVKEPLSCVVVTPQPDGQVAEVFDLRQPGAAYTVPLA